MKRLLLGTAPTLDPASSNKLAAILNKACGKSGGEPPQGTDELLRRLDWGKLPNLPALRHFDGEQREEVVRQIAEASFRWDEKSSTLQQILAPLDAWAMVMQPRTLHLALFTPPSAAPPEDIAFLESASVNLGPQVHVGLERPQIPHSDVRQWREDSERALDDAKSVKDFDSAAKIEAELRSLCSSPSWHTSWRVVLPVFGPAALLGDTAREFADWLTILPVMARWQSSMEPGDALFSTTSEALEGPPQPLEEVRQVAISGDVEPLLTWASQNGLFRLLTEGHERARRLRAALRLLAQARRQSQREFTVVLALSALEALCGLTQDEQIQQRVKDCTAVLFPPLERSGIRERLASMYARRNRLVHGEVGDGKRRKKESSSPGPTRHAAPDDVLIIAEALARFLRLSVRCPEVTKMSLREVLERYLTHDDTLAREIRSTCDVPDPEPDPSDLPSPPDAR